MKLRKTSDFTGDVLIHIGPHKTGSTSIQRCLADNYAALLEEGVLYPEAGRRGRKGVEHLHHPLALALAAGDRDACAAFVDDVAVELGQGQVRLVILSSEVLARGKLPADVFAEARALFPRANVRWLFYVRRQDELLLSLYAEGIKERLIAWPRGIAFYDTSAFLDHRMRYEKLRSAVADDPILVASFDDEKRELIPAFLRRLGVPPHVISETKVHANPSLPWSVLHVLRVTNALPKPLARLAGGLVRAAAGILPQREKPLTADERQDVRRRYADSNLWIERSFFEGRAVLTGDEDR